MGNPIIVSRESLQNGPLPKKMRERKNKAFQEALPESIPKRLSEWITKEYIDCEPCEIGIHFADPFTSKLGFLTSNIQGYIVNDENPKEESILSNLYLETPLMTAPFGVRKMGFEGQQHKYQVALQFDMQDKNHLNFYNNVKYIEEKSKEYFFENSKKITPKKHSKQYIEEIFRSNIRKSENNKFHPLLNVNFPPHLDKITCFEYQTQNRHKLTDLLKTNKLHPQCKVKIILKVKQLVNMQDQHVKILFEPIQMCFSESIDWKLNNTYMFDDSDELQTLTK